MKKTYKLSIPYLGKVAVVTVVSFSCAISAYQLSQNSSIFSPRSKALELKNNQVIFSNQDQQTHTHQEPDESQYLKENQQSLDKISQTNLNNSPYLFKNQGRVDPTKIYGQTGLGVNGNNTIGVNPNGTGDGNVTVVIPGQKIPINNTGKGISNEVVDKNTNHDNKTPIVDPDPIARLPDMSNDLIYGDASTFTNDGILQKEGASYTIQFLSTEFLSKESVDQLYEGCVITPWKLLCNMVVMIAENEEGKLPKLYRIEDYNDNFKIGSYPQYATEDFTVKFYFRMNASSPWQEYEVTFKVEYQTRISLQDYNQQETGYFYLKKEETEDLRKYYNLIVPTYQTQTQIFMGWKNEDGSDIDSQTAYIAHKKGRISLIPLEMKDLPEGYEVQLQSEYVFAEDLYTIYNYAFTGYSGDEFADIHVPEEVNSIEMNDAGWQDFYGDFYIPASIESAHFGWSGLQLYGKYIVDENNTKYSSNEDGLLMNKDQTIVYQTPIADAIYIPKGVTAIKGIVSWFVSDVYFDGPCMVDQSSFKNIQTDTIIHVPDEYYLDYFKKSYRRFVTNLINENGESYDYTVNNNLVFLNDERELVSTMDSAAGTIVIPETVEKIDDYAFSGNDKITCIIFTHGDVELGHQIFKDSHVEEVNFLTKDIPVIYSDTFSQADSLKAINVSINYYELYDDKWKNEIDQASFALLSETDSSFQTKNGFEYLEMYYRDRSHATILLNAPTDLIQFDENSIPGVTITEIGQHAFSECKNLKHVKLSKHINQIDSYAFYGCEALESIFSENTDSITIQENALEITDSWLFDLRYMAFNAKKAIFENDYVPSVTRQMYIPFDGEGYNGGNTYSGAYFIDESYGGEILYGYARGTDQNGNTVTVEDEFYLINATTDVQGDVATKEGTFEICTSAFEDVPITSIQFNMTDDMYWIDDYAFYGTNLTGELVLPDGLGPIGQVAFYGSNISKVIFPKTYGNDKDYPARLWTNTFGGDESLSEIVFQNATPIELFYNEFTEYTFGDMASEDFHITLSGAAKGLEQKYIDAWKYRFIACEDNAPSVNEEKLNQSVKKIAGLLGYTLPETSTQPDNNQEIVPDVEKAPEDNQQEVNDEEDQNDQQDENKQEALENEVDENDN